MMFNFGLMLLSGVFFSFSAMALSEDNRPEYQKEYDAYMRDLSIIAQTGQAPENLKLNADLAKMDSNEKIRLTLKEPKNTNMETSNIYILGQIKFAQLQAQSEIVNSVEVIRIPEEFLNEYADIYKEAVSTQELLDKQKNNKKRINDDDTMKIANHINPFRFLSEVKLSPIEGEYGTKELPLDPMASAYFNQFGRPYVSDAEKKVVDEKNKEKKEREKSSGYGLSLRNSMFVD